MSGANLRTCEIGIFPLAHVVDVDYNDFDPALGAGGAGAGAGATERKERYLLEYIGSVESALYKGNAVLYQVRAGKKSKVTQPKVGGRGVFLSLWSQKGHTKIAVLETIFFPTNLGIGGML